MERSSTSVDDHLASLPEPARPDLVELDSRIAEVMAGQERVLWEGTIWRGGSTRVLLAALSARHLA